MNLILASNNKGKITEIRDLLPEFSVRTMREAGYTDEIEEPFETFALNALQKADTVWKWAGTPVLADDSGLCVEALGGAPGVYSARYAGIGATDEENNHKLLREMDGVKNRSAYYFAQICLIIGGEPYYFEGRCRGQIGDTARGSEGFGYDPLFIPDGYTQTFAEIPASVKSRISHRAAALSALKDFLKSGAGAALLAPGV